MISSAGKGPIMPEPKPHSRRAGILSLVYYPFLLAVTPILFLFSHNLKRYPISPREAAIPLALALLLSFPVFGLSLAVFKNRHQSAFSAGYLLMAFFAFGPVYRSAAAAFSGAPGVLLIPFATMLLIIPGWFLLKTIKDWEGTTKFLSIFSIALIIMNLGTILVTLHRNRSLVSEPQDRVESYQGIKPDIYYIILDGYAGPDIMRDLYGYDNTDFLDSLEKRGFYIARESRSNYGQTSLSLASTLNMAYIGDLLKSQNPSSINRAPLLRLINTNAVFKEVKRLGYTTVSIGSGYFGAELKEADLYVDPQESRSEFLSLLIQTTPLFLIVKGLKGTSDLELRRIRVLNTFRTLENLKKSAQPVFVFSHIMAPHPPFIFNEDGGAEGLPVQFIVRDGSHFHGMDPTKVQDYILKYRAQAKFISRKTGETIDRLLDNADRPAVIILQADHGPGAFLDWENPVNTNLKERFSILNAFYFPDRDYSGFYPRISPVNSFRLVFNHLFKAGYPALEDKSYYSTWSRPFTFLDVGETANAPSH